MIADIGIGDVVRHFKGKYYRIIGFGKHTETGEEEVIYEALYPPFGIWVRPKDSFLSLAPEGQRQKHRFEVMTATDLIVAQAEFEENFRQEIRRENLTKMIQEVIASLPPVWSLEDIKREMLRSEEESSDGD